MENVRLFLSQKPQFKLEERIRIKSARAHHFFNLQRTGNKKISICGLINRVVPQSNDKKRGNNDLVRAKILFSSFSQSILVGLPEKILHFTITETLQIAISECFLTNCNQYYAFIVTYFENTPQGNFTILPSEMAFSINVCKPYLLIRMELLMKKLSNNKSLAIEFLINRHDRDD